MEIEKNSILEKHNELEPWDEDPNFYVDNIYYRSDFTKDEENYVLGAWPKVKSFLEDHGVSCELHLAEDFMTIAIARTVEQDIFDKARVALDLLPSDLAPWAIKLLNARQYEIIKIVYEDDGLIAKFGIDERECDERKELLLGPDDIYIKPLEELTGCFVIVNWNTDTVIATGLFEGLKLVRMIVEECIVCKIPAVDIISKIRTRGAGALLWEVMKQMIEMYNTRNCSFPKFAMGLTGILGIYSNMRLVGAGVPLLDAAHRRILND